MIRNVVMGLRRLGLLRSTTGRDAGLRPVGWDFAVARVQFEVDA